MTHVIGLDRAQALLMPKSLDDYVGPDNRVRFVEAFVDGLDQPAAGFMESGLALRFSFHSRPTDDTDGGSKHGRQMRLIPAIAALLLLGAPSLATAASYRAVYTFQGGLDGAYSNARLLAVEGQLYGTTYYGGSATCADANEAGCGTVFTVNPVTGSEKVIHAFSNHTADGIYPSSTLLDLGGTLFGTAQQGGTSFNGTIFSLDSAGTEHIVFSFPLSGATGAQPGSGLIRAGNALYGTTLTGGISHNGGRGTVYKLDAAGTETLVHAFAGAPDGDSPESDLVAAGNGTLYGVTTFGGAHNAGAIYAINPTDNAELVVYSFTGDRGGSAPNGALVASSGLLYGTTAYGGAANLGTVFAFNPATGLQTSLYAFAGGRDGATPAAGVTLVDGVLYGTTNAGGSTSCNRHGCGTAYALSAARGETILHVFRGGADGARPNAGLTRLGHQLFGTTSIGGTYQTCRQGCGTVFALTLTP